MIRVPLLRRRPHWLFLWVVSWLPVLAPCRLPHRDGLLPGVPPSLAPMLHTPLVPPVLRRALGCLLGVCPQLLWRGVPAGPPAGLAPGHAARRCGRRPRAGPATVSASVQDNVSLLGPDEESARRPTSTFPRCTHAVLRQESARRGAHFSFSVGSGRASCPPSSLCILRTFFKLHAQVICTMTSVARIAVRGIAYCCSSPTTRETNERYLGVVWGRHHTPPRLARSPRREVVPAEP